jgi:hypothetical protein
MRRRQDPKAKAAMIAIEALTALAFGLAVVTTANVIRAHAADDDLLPRAGETTREYQARISKDPQRIEQVRKQIAEEQRQADELERQRRADAEEARHNRALERERARSNST